MHRVRTPLRVGLVGAGPWARSVHEPGLAKHPNVELAAVWARRAKAAGALAEAHGAHACASMDELLARVDVVAFAVPPAVQARLAPWAAAAGKHLILEKPIAADVPSAECLVAAVEDAGVTALIMLTLRYATQTRQWLASLAEQDGWRGGNATWLSAALLGDAYGDSAWRLEQGALADVGPHVIDLLDAALGEITRVLAAHRDDEDLWQLLFAHSGGATSTASLSLRLPVRPTVAEFAVYGKGGYQSFARRPGMALECYTTMLDDVAAMIDRAAVRHPCDIRRGLHLQRILAEAATLAGG